MTNRDAAVIGLGNMGRGIARNLDRAGRLAAAWDVSEAARTRAELSSEVALVPPSQFGRLGFILFVVPGSAQIEETASRWIRASSPKGKLVRNSGSEPPQCEAISVRVFLTCGGLSDAAFSDERLDCIHGQLHDAPIFAEQREPRAPDIDHLPDAVIPRQGRTGTEGFE